MIKSVKADHNEDGYEFYFKETAKVDRNGFFTPTAFFLSKAGSFIQDTVYGPESPLGRTWTRTNFKTSVLVSAR